MQYAAHNSAPEVGSAIKPESAGQSEFLKAAAVNGFRSSLIIPTHAGSKSHIGVFCLGSSKSPQHAEPRMLESRNFLRAIAMELFEWWENKIAGEMLERCRLDEAEIELLKLEQNGFTAEDAAKVFGQTTSQINSRFRRINEKLDVHHKCHAVERAIELGILQG